MSKRRHWEGISRELDEALASGGYTPAERKKWLSNLGEALVSADRERLEADLREMMANGDLVSVCAEITAAVVPMRVQSAAHRAVVGLGGEAGDRLRKLLAQKDAHVRELWAAARPGMANREPDAFPGALDWGAVAGHAGPTRLEVRLHRRIELAAKYLRDEGWKNHIGIYLDDVDSDVRARVIDACEKVFITYVRVASVREAEGDEACADMQVPMLAAESTTEDSGTRRAGVLLLPMSSLVTYKGRELDRYLWQLLGVLFPVGSHDEPGLVELGKLGLTRDDCVTIADLVYEIVKEVSAHVLGGGDEHALRHRLGYLNGHVEGGRNATTVWRHVKRVGKMAEEAARKLREEPGPEDE